MQKTDSYDRRQNRSFDPAGADHVDLDQRDGQRRTTVRIPLRLWTEGRRNGALDFHNCSNVSETGMFIETPDPYPLNALVNIEFNLPGVHEPVRVTGRAVSSLDDANAAEHIMGNGFLFEHVTPADQELLRAYVDASLMAHTL